MDVLKTHVQVGNAVRFARESRGMTQRQLSQASGVSLRSITDLELGAARNIGLDRTMRVLNALGLSLCICDAQSREAGRERPDLDMTYDSALDIIRGGTR